jgi:hypothetical protein
MVLFIGTSWFVSHIKLNYWIGYNIFMVEVISSSVAQAIVREPSWILPFETGLRLSAK